MLHQQQTADRFEAVPSNLKNSHRQHSVVGCFHHYCPVAEHTSCKEQNMQHQKPDTVGKALQVNFREYFVCSKACQPAPRAHQHQHTCSTQRKLLAFRCSVQKQ